MSINEAPLIPSMRYQRRCARKRLFPSVAMCQVTRVVRLQSSEKTTSDCADSQVPSRPVAFNAGSPFAREPRSDLTSLGQTSDVVPYSPSSDILYHGTASLRVFGTRRNPNAILARSQINERTLRCKLDRRQCLDGDRLVHFACRDARTYWPHHLSIKTNKFGIAQIRPPLGLCRRKLLRSPRDLDTQLEARHLIAEVTCITHATFHVQRPRWGFGPCPMIAAPCRVRIIMPTEMGPATVLSTMAQIATLKACGLTRPPCLAMLMTRKPISPRDIRAVPRNRDAGQTRGLPEVAVSVAVREALSPLRSAVPSIEDDATVLDEAR